MPFALRYVEKKGKSGRLLRSKLLKLRVHADSIPSALTIFSYFWKVGEWIPRNGVGGFVVPNSTKVRGRMLSVAVRRPFRFGPFAIEVVEHLRKTQFAALQSWRTNLKEHSHVVSVQERVKAALLVCMMRLP